MGLLFWLVVIPLIAALLIVVLPRLGSGLYKTLALVGTLVPLIMTFVAWDIFNTTTPGYQLMSHLTWFTLPNAGIGSNTGVTVALSFGVDGLSLPLLTLAGFVSVLAVIAAGRRNDRSKTYFFWLTLASAGIYAVFTALDLFTFFVGLEITLFSAFFLIYLFGEGNHRRAAFKFIIYRGLATVFLFVSLIGFAYAAVGVWGGATPVPQQGLSGVTFSIPALTHTLFNVPTGVLHALFITLLIGVLIEEAFVPFHTWLPTAHEAADTATSMMLGGVLTKTGAYVLLRFGIGFMPNAVHDFGTLIAIIGTINILYGAFAAWAQKDWRRLIAFGSISHMGLVLLGVASMQSAGLQGAMFMIVSSGLLTALLFFITGTMKNRTGTMLMPSLGGLSKSLPVLSGFLLVAALGSLGLPLTSGFISEIQAFMGGFQTFPAISFVAVLGVVLSAVYLLYAIQKTTFGPTAEAHLALTDAQPIEYVPMFVLTALVIVIGVYPDVIGSLFGPSVHALLRIGG